MSDVHPVTTRQYDQLPVAIYDSNAALGAAAALDARQIIQAAIAQRGEASIVVATGNSQLSFLHALRELEGIAWEAVRIFHMDEYVGIAPDNPASFPYFLREHFISYINPLAFYPMPGQPEDVDVACAAYTALLKQYPADMVALGWGENGHLAFNDPPYADFNDPAWVKVVTLAAASRQQQLNEGHFASLDKVPTQALTMTIPALLASKRILCIVPEARKAPAVHACLTQPVSDKRPGSILRTVSHAQLYLDRESSQKL